MSSIDPSDEPTAAETGWRAVIDPQRDDFALLRSRWPDRESPESLAAIERLHRRVAPGGDAGQASHAVTEAYGGRVPDAVSDRLEDYVRERLGGGGSPDDLRERPRYRPAIRRQKADDGR